MKMIQKSQNRQGGFWHTIKCLSSDCQRGIWGPRDAAAAGGNRGQEMEGESGMHPGAALGSRWFWWRNLGTPGLPSGKQPHNHGKIHHFEWVNQRFLWPFSIAFCMFTRGHAMFFPSFFWAFRRAARSTFARSCCRLWSRWRAAPHCSWPIAFLPLSPNWPRHYGLVLTWWKLGSAYVSFFSHKEEHPLEMLGPER